MGLVIDWVTERIPSTDQHRDGAFDRRYGEVAGKKRFRVIHVGAGTEDLWEACELDGVELVPPFEQFRGTYAECVDWCWGRLTRNGSEGFA